MVVLACVQMSTDGAHGTGSGYHIWGGWSSSPHDGAVKAYLFTRSVHSTTAGCYDSCSHVLAQGLPSGTYSMCGGGDAFDVYCDNGTSCPRPSLCICVSLLLLASC
jgi:hypothetical protein